MSSSKFNFLNSVSSYTTRSYTNINQLLKYKKITRFLSCRSHWKRLICLTDDKEVGSCDTDHGGPLLVGNKLVGINHMLVHTASCFHELDEHSPDECHERNVTTIYVYLCYHSNWLHKMVPQVYTEVRCNALAPACCVQSVCNLMCVLILLYVLQ